MIQAERLWKTFVMGQNTVDALAGIDLSIPAGSFTVVMGPSGSGKSTLLYLIGGLDRPTAGSLSVNNQRIDSLDENQLAVYRRSQVGFIFQSFNLIPSMTAQQNVAFPMRFAGIPSRRRREHASQLLERVGLGDRMHHRPTELSGGQQQRVAIARALINDPLLVLADEPTGNLDSGSGASIMLLLSQLHQEGRTVLVVSHDPRMTHYATHKVYLLDGRVIPEQEYLVATSS